MNIYESINAVMNEVGAVGKTSKNVQQGFMFRGIDAVMNALNPAMIKFKIFVVPECLEQSREERKSAKGNMLLYSILKMKYTFYAEDGSSVFAITIGEGMDSGDKASNKAMAIAFKYACFQVFCIPTEEMKDPDAECHEVQPEDNKAQANSKPKANNQGAKNKNNKDDEKYITEAQFRELESLCKEADRDMHDIAKKMGCESLMVLPKEKFEITKNAFLAIIKTKQEGEK